MKELIERLRDPDNCNVLDDVDEAADAIENLLVQNEQLTAALNDMRDDFVDFVCSGIHNPAPYCQNRRDECVDRLGWCAPGSDVCKGFAPKGVQNEQN